MPPNYQIAFFPKGITMLTCVSGKEHKNICQILLELIVNLQLCGSSSPVHLFKAMCGLLDFLYLAQLPSQMTDMISHLEQSLVTFYANKDIFVDLGVQGHFNILKLHSLLHYSLSNTLFGSTDNYNTKQTEQLHINFMKDAYHVMNHKDKYAQITTWLECCKKLQQYAVCIKWWQQQHLTTGVLPQRPIGVLQPGTYYLKMTWNPILWRVLFNSITNNYGAIDFQDLLGNFLVHLRWPHLSGWALYNHRENTLIPFHHIPAFHKIKFTDGDGAIIDSVHIWLEQVDPHGQIIPVHFDTVLIWTGQQPDNA